MMSINRFFLLSWIVLAPTTTFSQDKDKSNWPTIPAQAPTIKMFAPKGWYIEWDTIASLIPMVKETHVIVLREHDTKNQPPLGARSVHIIAKDSTGLYKLIASNRSLVQWGEEGMLHFWDLSGSIWVHGDVVFIDRVWLNGDAMYRFRFDKSSQKFMLIGLEYEDIGRNGSPQLHDSRNYLNGKRNISYSRMEMHPPYQYEDPLRTTTKLHGKSISFEDIDSIEMDSDAFTYAILRQKWVPENFEEQEQLLNSQRNKRKK